MGDRANVRMLYGVDEPKVYLYTHWEGSRLPLIVKEALSKRWRWNDPAYLARIIFCQMVGDCAASETGYGISSTPPDNEHPIIEVDPVIQEVRFLASPEASGGRFHATFEEYITMKDEWILDQYDRIEV